MPLGLIAAALVVVMTTGSARAGAAVSRAQAIRAALRALGVQNHTGAEIVFGLRAPIRARTVVTVAGPARPASGGRPTSAVAGVIARPRRAAWFFYDDQAPFEAYQHPGRVALVDTVTGRVTLSASLRWPPAFGGAMPAFLRSAAAYADPAARVFYRPYRGDAALAQSARRPHPAFDATQARRVGALLASERACVAELGDSLPGGYYGYAGLSRSFGAIGTRFSQLQHSAPGFRSSAYPRGARETPTAFVRSMIAEHHCRRVLLYLAGAGYEHASAINIGMQLAGGRVRHQDLTAASLRGLIGGQRAVTFLLVVDAPFAAGFQRLASLPNVRLVATPVAPAARSFLYLPEAVVGGALRQNDTNPFRVLQLTDRLAFGLNEVVDDPCESTTAAALARRGTSTLGYLVARAFAAGGVVDWVARAGVGSPPLVRTAGISATAPRCLPADALGAVDDSYTVRNNAFFGTTGAEGVLANDSDTQHHTIVIDQLNGSGGTVPLHGTSAQGAAVTMHGDGAFSYDASAVAALQALPRGQTTTDTFTYRARDGFGATATATVTLTVLGARNHPPSAEADTAAVSISASPLTGTDVRANDTDLDGDPLTIDQLGGVGGTPPLHGTSVKGATVTLNADGTYSYDPSTSATLQALPHGATATDSFTYRVGDGHGGTATAPVTITVGGSNHAPVANPDSYQTNADTTLSPLAAAGVLANDTDADGDVLHVTGPTTSTDGAAVTLHADGSFTYDPSGSATLKELGAGVQTTDTFTYTASDGNLGTSTATVSITVTGVNDAPTAVADGTAGSPVASTTSDTPLSGQASLFTNDTDPDAGDTLTLNTAETTSAKGATVSVNSDGTWSYDPISSSTLQALPHGQSTTDTFTYSVKDSHNAASNTATVTVGVTGVNHAPVASPDSYTVAAGQTLSDGSSVLANDTDADNDPLAATLVSGPSHASSFTLNADGTFSYTNDGTLGSDSFTYKANDGTTDSATVTVTIDVSP